MVQGIEPTGVVVVADACRLPPPAAQRGRGTGTGSKVDPAVGQASKGRHLTGQEQFAAIVGQKIGDDRSDTDRRRRRRNRPKGDPGLGIQPIRRLAEIDRVEPDRFGVPRCRHREVGVGGPELEGESHDERSAR